MERKGNRLARESSNHACDIALKKEEDVFCPSRMADRRAVDE
jgi:hypothetical protein